MHCCIMRHLLIVNIALFQSVHFRMVISLHILSEPNLFVSSSPLLKERMELLNVSQCCLGCSDHNFYNDANHLAMAEQHNEMQCNHIITTLPCSPSQKAGRGPGVAAMFIKTNKHFTPQDSILTIA